MPRSLYVAAIEPNSGKSLVVLGLMELLSHRIDKLGFYRPVIRSLSEDDPHVDLIRSRYDLASRQDRLFATAHDEARRMVSNGRENALLKQILSQYHEIGQDCDFVVCEGTDFSGLTAAFEFEFNAQIASHLSCPVVIVTNGHRKAAADILQDIQAARQGFIELGCAIAATVVNRVDEDDLQGLNEKIQAQWSADDPIFAIPDSPLLSMPTIGEIAAALEAECHYEGDDGLNRVASDYKVAAMHIPHFLDHLSEGTLVITPSDRADIILTSLMAFYAETFPHISGIVLTGGIEPAPSVRKLIDGLRRLSLPILRAHSDTFAVATQISQVPAVIRSDNHRKVAAALGLFESNIDLQQLEDRISVVRSSSVTPLMFEYELIERAKRQRKHIVLPEATDERILRAAEILLIRDVVDVTLLGPEIEVGERIAAMGLQLEDAHIIDPVESPRHAEFTAEFLKQRGHKGVTEDQAHDLMHDPTYFGTMMVHLGLADGMVSGAAHTTANTIRPAFQLIRAKPDYSVVSSVFLMCLDDHVLVYGDCAIVTRPTAEQLADIAIASAQTAAMFDIEPRIAMLSYSSGQSGHGTDVDKVRQATRLVQQRAPELLVDGPIQYDAAVDPGVAAKKMPGSKVAGQATVFIFPDLNTGNNTYKAVQRTAGAVAVGPVLQGLNKPVNDLSRGCTVPDIVSTVAITAIQAQETN
jgi:phosphate acetyltransferase